jgi:hypothetical protein
LQIIKFTNLEPWGGGKIKKSTFTSCFIAIIILCKEITCYLDKVADAMTVFFATKLADPRINVCFESTSHRLFLTCRGEKYE